MTAEGIFPEETVDDFLWRCGVCGQTGRGSKSQSHHANIHGLKNIATYIPERRLRPLTARLQEAYDAIEGLEAKVPPEGVRALDEDDLRALVYNVLEAAWMDRFEDTFGEGDNVHDRTISWVKALIQEDHFFDSILAEFDQERADNESARRLRELRRKNEHRDWIERRLPELRAEVAELEAEIAQLESEDQG